MLADHLIHVIHRQFLQLLPHHLRELANTVPARIQRIAQLLVRSCRQEIDILHQVITRLDEVFRTQSVFDQLGNFMQRDANRHLGVLWNHRANPHLEDLSPPRNIRIGKKLDTSRGETLRYTHSHRSSFPGSHESGRKGATLRNGVRPAKCGPDSMRQIGVRPCHFNGKTEGDGRGACFLLDDLNFESLRASSDRFSGICQSRAVPGDSGAPQ